MAQDRMTNDDLDRKQTPGRNPQQDQQTGQKGTGQKDKPVNVDDEDLDAGKAGKNR